MERSFLRYSQCFMVPKFALLPRVHSITGSDAMQLVVAVNHLEEPKRQQVSPKRCCFSTTATHRLKKLKSHVNLMFF